MSQIYWDNDTGDLTLSQISNEMENEGSVFDDLTNLSLTQTEKYDIEKYDCEFGTCVPKK